MSLLFANGLTVRNFLLLFKEPLFFAHLKQSIIIKTRFIAYVFANLRLPHKIVFTEWKHEQRC